MSDRNVFLILSILFLLVLDIYTFRFQRTTLSLSRMAIGVGRADFQVQLTPAWMGVLGWLRTALLILNLFLLFFWVGWWAALLLLFYSLVVSAFVDVITPVPSYAHCLNIVEQHLEKEAKRAIVESDLEKHKAVEALMTLVRSARSEYNL